MIDPTRFFTFGIAPELLYCRNQIFLDDCIGLF
jgi:hypothetical protein